MKIKFLLFVSLLAANCAFGGAEIMKDSFQVVFHEQLKPEDAKKASETGKLPGRINKIRFPDSMVFDLRTLFKTAKVGRDNALLCFNIVADSDCTRTIGLSADYWFTCYLNGKMIGTTEPVGENYYKINPYNRGYKISLKKGSNLVVLHTRPGVASWKVSCRLYPDVADWPADQKDRMNVFKYQFPVPEIIIGPEVTHVSTESAVILYYKGERDSLFLTYWKKGDEQKKKTVNLPTVYGRIPQKNLFRFEVKNLDPESNYNYELRSYATEKKVASGSFRTPPAKGGTHTLVAISDTQAYYENRAAMIRSMIKKKMFAGADLLVSLGDVDDGLENFNQVYFESFLNLFRGAGIKIPFYPVRGNHEFRGVETELYSDWFGCPYYAFRYGDVFYIVLDTGEDKPRQKVGHEYTLLTDTAEYFKAQRAWLKRVIKSDACRNAKYRIVLAHAPPFEWDYKYMASQISSFADCFLGKNPECRIDLWLCGHTHSPYRFDPVTGELAGAKRKFSKKKRGKLTAKDKRDIHFPVYVNDGPGGAGQSYSVSKVFVGKDHLQVTCIGVDGSVMDKIEIRRGKPFKILETTYVKYDSETGIK